MLTFQMDKPDLWDDPVHAGRISREHGSLMGKTKEVNGIEQELLEHIDMIKLAQEEDDPDLESVGSASCFTSHLYYYLPAYFFFEMCSMFFLVHDYYA